MKKHNKKKTKQSITIFYFAKEGDNCKFSPVYPEIKPVKIPFKKGLGQKFCQPSGTGVDLGFFDVNDLSKPLQGEEIFPLVISAESCLPSIPPAENYNGKSLDKSPHSQITEAVLVKKSNEDHFQVKVIKQILWIEGVRYELREIYGINNSDETNVKDDESGKECVICMTEPKDTAVLPCRHMMLLCYNLRRTAPQKLSVKMGEPKAINSRYQYFVVPTWDFAMDHNKPPRSASVVLDGSTLGSFHFTYVGSSFPGSPLRVSECAKELRHQSNKCPICRQPIEELLEIKVNEEKGDAGNICTGSKVEKKEDMTNLGFGSTRILRRQKAENVV
ncbi:putative E3 ubiquitin-protein ligase LUL3 [Capsicum annuum]|nr:putative E3 ubiquitin-protein ligase LUL3 [Capsicum annuum]